MNNYPEGMSMAEFDRYNDPVYEEFDMGVESNLHCEECGAVNDAMVVARIDDGYRYEEFGCPTCGETTLLDSFQEGN